MGIYPDSTCLHPEFPSETRDSFSRSSSCGSLVGEGTDDAGIYPDSTCPHPEFHSDTDERLVECEPGFFQKARHKISGFFSYMKNCCIFLFCCGSVGKPCADTDTADPASEVPASEDSLGPLLNLRGVLNGITELPPRPPFYFGNRYKEQCLVHIASQCYTPITTNGKKKKPTTGTPSKKKRRGTGTPCKKPPREAKIEDDVSGINSKPAAPPSPAPTPMAVC